MTIRSLKLLTVSTAFIAATASAHAINITTATTVPVYTSATGPITLSGSGSISVTSGSAIYVSNTSAASNTITIGTGTTLSAPSATIISDNPANGAITINNSGTIIGDENADFMAIDLTGTTSSNTLNSSGNITGVIDMGNGPATVNITSGTINYLITGTASDTITINNATVDGMIHTDTGNDTVSITNSNIATIDIGMGNDTLTVSNTTVGKIYSSTGTSNVTLTNVTSRGIITDTELSDQDVLTINGTRTFTTGNAISGFENVHFDTTTNLNHGFSDANKVYIGQGATLQVNNSFTTGSGGELNNSGTLSIAAGKNVTAGTYTADPGSRIRIGINSSNTTTGMGQINLTSGSLATGTSVTISMASQAGYIASGTQYVIATGTSATNVSLTNSTSGVMRYSTLSSGTDVLLHVGRVSTTSVVTGQNAQNAAAALDQIAGNTSGTLTTVQGLIGGQTSAAGVTNIVNSLTPNIEGAGIASLNITHENSEVVSTRLASLRSTGTGVATGDGLNTQHAWMQGYGGKATQDDKDGVYGYDATSGGVTVGLDTDIMAGVTTGVAVSYGKASVDSNNVNAASTDIDSYIATLYAARVFENGIYLNGQLGYAYNQYDIKRTIPGIGNAKGETNGWQGTAKLEGGRDFAVGNFTFTPLASLQYTYLDMDSYRETGVGSAGLFVTPEAMNALDTGIGMQLGYALALASGATLTPSVHAMYVYRFGDTAMGSSSSFLGGGPNFVTDGVEADRGSVNLGAGLIFTSLGGTDLSLNYDADLRSSMTAQTGQVRARWAF